MFEKGKREQRASKEDAAFNKMLLWLAGAVVVELVILFLRQVYVNLLFGGAVAYGLKVFFQVFSFAGAALVAAGVVWAVLRVRGGKSAVLPWACTAGVALLWVVSGFAYYLFDAGMNIMMVMPAAGAVLIVIFFLYQRGFFLNAMLAGGGLAALWMFREYYMDHPTTVRVCFALGFAALAAAVVLAFLLIRNGGKLGRVQVMPADTSYLLTWVTCALTAVSMVLGLVMGAGVAYYLLFVLAGWLFIQAVFFTVKLM